MWRGPLRCAFYGTSPQKGWRVDRRLGSERLAARHETVTPLPAQSAPRRVGNALSELSTAPGGEGRAEQHPSLIER